MVALAAFGIPISNFLGTSAHGAVMTNDNASPAASHVMHIQETHFLERLYYRASLDIGIKRGVEDIVDDRCLEL
jgi:hypothetical protein